MRPVRVQMTVALLCVALAWPLVAASGDGSDPLAEANALYRAGEFARAAEEYRARLAAGDDGPRTHYNLANALYRSDRLGEAVAHYLAAATMTPRDADVRANLSRALSERPAGPPPPSASWLHAAGAAVIGHFTLSEFAGVAALLYWIAMAALLALLLERGRPRRMRQVAIVCGALALAASAFGFGTRPRWRLDQGGG